MIKFVPILTVLLSTIGTMNANEATQRLISKRNESFLTGVASLLEEPKAYDKTYLLDWVYGEDDNIPLYEDAAMAFVKDDVTKTSAIFALSLDYMINKKMDIEVPLDTIKGTLDHFIPLKFSMISFVDELQSETFEIGDYYQFGLEIYEGINEISIDMFGYDVYSDFYGDLKDYLIAESSYYETNIDYSWSLYNKYESLTYYFVKNFTEYVTYFDSNIAKYQNLMLEYVTGDAFTKTDPDEILGFTVDEAQGYSLEDNQEKLSELADKSFRAMGYFLRKYDVIFNNYEINTKLLKHYLNNFGPLEYKILDFCEAVYNDDYINICLLAHEVVEDINLDLDWIGENVDSKTRPISFTEFRKILNGDIYVLSSEYNAKFNTLSINYAHFEERLTQIESGLSRRKYKENMDLLDAIETELLADKASINEELEKVNSRDVELGNLSALNQEQLDKVASLREQVKPDKPNVALIISIIAAVLLLILLILVILYVVNKKKKQQKESN